MESMPRGVLVVQTVASPRQSMVELLFRPREARPFVRHVRPVQAMTPRIFGVLASVLLPGKNGRGTRSLRNPWERSSQAKKRRRARRSGSLSRSGF